MKKKPVDLVYVLGKESRWNNNEIRFSLRSVCKYLTNVGHIFIVGEFPDFIQNCIHIPCPDIFDPAVNADGNMTHKLLTVCNRPELSDVFLFMNDDFIINQRMAANKIAWMHKGDMAHQPPAYWTSQFYRFRLKRTFDELQARNMPTLQYDYHAPMLMDKNSFISTMKEFDYSKDIGYTFRSIYGNSLRLPAIPVQGEKKTFFSYHNIQQINLFSNIIKFIGYNDNGLNDSLKWWLINRFPEKCKYENNLPSDRIMDVYFWIKNGKQYQEGIEVFSKHYNHKNLLMMFNDRDTPKLREKLNYKLMQLIRHL